ncbi:hypothetical protein WJX72_009425 [[Myrmecia] bisecta]|uniref:Uncharacterized protein n=1 Tax=[Myrmecia] bisecta TaxID=41462 RepID=A0AAW1PFS1_9CHLO
MTAEAAVQGFKAFDFDSNEAWLKYRLNLEIPADRDEAAVLQRYKAKFYQRQIDPSFNPAMVQTGGSASASAKPAAAEPTHGKEQAGSASGGQSSTTKGTSSHTGADASPKAAAVKTLEGWRSTLFQWLQAGPQGLLFGLHTLLLLLALVYLQPLKPRLSWAAWRLSQQVALVMYAYKVFLKAGAPPLRPFPAGIKNWVARVTPSTDFQYLLMTLMFLTARPITLVLVPTLVLALYHTSAFAASRFGQHPLWRKYGAPAHAWLTSRQTQALTYNAAAEIGVGFLVIAALLSPPRNLLLVFLYWNFLRMRFYSPDAAAYHRQVWGSINMKVSPLLDRVPALRMPIGYVQRWFLNMGQARPAR